MEIHARHIPYRNSKLTQLLQEGPGLSDIVPLIQSVCHPKIWKGILAGKLMQNLAFASPRYVGTMICLKPEGQLWRFSLMPDGPLLDVQYALVVFESVCLSRSDDSIHTLPAVAWKPLRKHASALRFPFH